jgi:hypothetical protein
MDDPVLHRKIFRANALKKGALKPKGYVLGAGPLGITGLLLIHIIQQNLKDNSLENLSKVE